MADVIRPASNPYVGSLDQEVPPLKDHHDSFDATPSTAGSSVSPSSPPAAPLIHATCAPPIAAIKVPPTRAPTIDRSITINHVDLKRERNLLRFSYLFVLIVPWIIFRVGEWLYLNLRFAVHTTDAEKSLFKQLKSLNIDLHDASLSHRDSGIALKRLVNNWSRYKDRTNIRINHSNSFHFNGLQQFTFTMWQGKTIVTLHNRVADHASDSVKVKRAVVIDNESGDAKLMYEKRGGYKMGGSINTVLTPVTETLELATTPAEKAQRPFNAHVIRGDATEAQLYEIFGAPLDVKHQAEEYVDSAFVGVEFDYGAQGAVTKLIRFGQSLVPGYHNRRACHVFNVIGYQRVDGELGLVMADSLGALHTKKEYFTPLSQLHMGQELVFFKPEAPIYGVDADEYSKTVAKILYQNVDSDTTLPYTPSRAATRADDTYDWGYDFIGCGLSPIRSNKMGKKGLERLAQSMYYFLRNERMKVLGTTSVKKEFCSAFSLRASQTALIHLLFTKDERLALAEYAKHGHTELYKSAFEKYLKDVLTRNPSLEHDAFFWKDSSHISPSSYFAAVSTKSRSIHQLKIDHKTVGARRAREAQRAAEDHAANAPL